MTAKLNTKPKVKKEPVKIGPCSEMQALVFQRATEVDFLLIGGSRGGGKSEVITQIPLMWRDDPNFTGMFTRTEINQLMGSGGLWETANKYYPLFKAKSVRSPVPMFTFPSGARIRYKQISGLTDAEKMRGLQLSYLGIDEITQLPREAVLQLLATLRSEANMNSVCIGTCNPQKNSWVFDLVSWYLDEEGFVDPAKNGKIRYYVAKDGTFVFADEESWFLENMPDAVTNSSDGSYIPPKKFCFCQLTIFQNKILLEKNPRYLSELQNLPAHERDAQLYGNWYAVPDSVPYFSRASVRGIDGEKVVSTLPSTTQKVCAWDKAGTEYVPKINNTDADFTASIHMAKCQDGYLYLYGNYCPENYDPHEKVYGKFRKGVGDRDRIMLKQAEYDGKDVPILISQDAGADGRQLFQEMAKKFVTYGFRVVPSTTAVTAGKWSKFEPFLMACQAGLVKIVESSFDPRTLELLYKELETFAPTLPNGKPWRSSRSIKDDFCDAVAEAYNYLSKAQYIPSFTLPTLSKSNEFNF
jgi:phage terminase large subunit-like protein